ncbi:hypothetical protein [Mycolicibacterium wolinskyi]|uniref:hypothetical protein n=1 Tax=Mycolicibacterium wolinskyi TaxID=59750 RepID=UPI0039176F81
MGLLKIRRGETVTVARVTRDGSGDATTPKADVRKSAFGKPETVAIEDDQRGRRTVVERNWFCHRTGPGGQPVDVEAGDRITRANGETYSVLAGPFGDNDHPLTGSDLGVKRYRVRRVGAPRG